MSWRLLRHGSSARGARFSTHSWPRPRRAICLPCSSLAWQSLCSYSFRPCACTARCGSTPASTSLYASSLPLCSTWLWAMRLISWCLASSCLCPAPLAALPSCSWCAALRASWCACIPPAVGASWASTRPATRLARLWWAPARRARSRLRACSPTTPTCLATPLFSWTTTPISSVSASAASRSAVRWKTSLPCARPTASSKSLSPCPAPRVRSATASCSPASRAACAPLPFPWCRICPAKQTPRSRCARLRSPTCSLAMRLRLIWARWATSPASACS